MSSSASVGAGDDRRGPDALVSGVFDDIAQFPFSPQARVRDFIYTIVDQRESEGDERNGQPGWNKRPPGTEQQGRAVLGPVEIRSPGYLARAGQSEKTQAG